jgi:hypothetical protein
MRRQERCMDAVTIEEILQNGKYGVLSVQGTDYPYGVPLSYAFKGDDIYLHMAVAGLKLELLRAAPKVSFCVVGEAEPLPEKFSMAYQSVIVFGTAEELFEQEKAAALELLLLKYSPEQLERGREYIKAAGGRTLVYKIAIKQRSGKYRPAAV